MRPKLEHAGSMLISSGGLVPVKVKRCRREVKKRKSSTLARASPRHARFPEGKEKERGHCQSADPITELKLTRGSQVSC